MSSLSAYPGHQIKVWVLVPTAESDDATVAYYLDFSQSIAEYDKTFSALGIEWQWQPVTIADFASVIEQIDEEHRSGSKIPLVLNLCDGDEINGTPGLSVVKLLEEKQLIYTGADEYFYNITTSKIPMKQAFDQAGVPTAPWTSIHDREQDLQSVFESLGTTLIVKPSVSGGSMGVGVQNVVHNIQQLKDIVEKMYSGYRGWNLVSDGLIAEAFITGPEFTVLITGSYYDRAGAKVYTPVERVFHHSLPEQERFLSFDRLWAIYEDETPMPGGANFYDYALPDPELIEGIKEVAWAAYVATKGCGYTRVDIRMDRASGKMYVLEVNAQCGLSEDEDFTSIGAILRLSKSSFANLVADIMNDAFIRHSTKAIKNRKLSLAPEPLQ